MTSNELGQLALLTVRDPRSAARVILTRGADAQTGWLGLAFVAVLSVLIMWLVLALDPTAEAAFYGLASVGPLMAALLQALGILAGAAAVTWIGRLFKGEGQFPQALTLIVWLDFLTVLSSMAQLLLMLSLPLLGIVLGYVTIALFLRALVAFIAALHGFQRLWLVAVLSAVCFLALSFALAFLMILLGYTPPMPGAA